MSRTSKDSPSCKSKTILELIKRPDGTFDLFLNGSLDCGSILEKYLPQELCIRFGFCGDEYDSILRAVNKNGGTKVEF